MISTSQLRELGYSYPPKTSEQLNPVKYYRRCNNKYTDTIAATNSLNRTRKQPIMPQERPFKKSFEYGTSAEGFWAYGRMVLQVEDCTDFLITLHPKLYIVFLLDHSCGHVSGRGDGLNVNRMGSGYGGLSHLEMNPTKIKQESGYLGPCPHIVESGQVQHMIFQDNNNGPFWGVPE